MASMLRGPGRMGVMLFGSRPNPWLDRLIYPTQRTPTRPPPVSRFRFCLARRRKGNQKKRKEKKGKRQRSPIQYTAVYRKHRESISVYFNLGIMYLVYLYP
jgi:hypothetical protein